jgi:hypothetical protein
MKKNKIARRPSNQLSREQLANAGGGSFGCNVFGGLVGWGTGSAMTAFPPTAPFAGAGGFAAGVGASEACDWATSQGGPTYPTDDYGGWMWGA